MQSSKTYNFGKCVSAKSAILYSLLACNVLHRHLLDDMNIEHLPLNIDYLQLPSELGCNRGFNDYMVSQT